jgi:Domain of unknown function (DUF4352)
MSYELPPQRPSFTPPPDPGYAAPDYDQRRTGQPWAQQPYAQQQPPYYPPPQQQYYPPQQPPKKKRHWVRNSFLGLAGFIVLIVIVSVAANEGGNSTPAAGSGAESANAAPAAPQVAKIGTPVRDGKFQFTITSVSHAKSVGDTADGLGDTAQGKYTILHVTVTNIGSQPQTLDDSSQYVYDASGRKYDASTSVDMDLNSASGSDSVFFNDINPGNTVRGELAFDMPAGLKAVKAELHDSAFSGGVTVNLR